MGVQVELKMKFVCTNALREYMAKKDRQVICVEVASSNASDFEVTEIFLRLAKESFASYLIEKKKYRRYPLEGGGSVLLPPYRLEYDEVITFDRKKKWLIYVLSQEGIRL